MKFSRTLLLLVIVCLLCSLSFADTVVLKKGQKLTGDIIMEKDTKLYMDIGVTVLAIAKKDILEYEFSQAAEAQEIDVIDIVGAAVAVSDSNQLYRTADLKKTTVEKCVQRVSEAVVKVSTPGGMGSGFFLNEDGYLITNYHVIERETKIEVTVFQKVKDGFEKKKFKKVKIEAINPFVDLALLKIEDLEDTKIKYVNLGEYKSLRVGEEVFAIGNPLGLERTVTNGVVSTKNRAFKGLIYIQTNADINPGNSGGPLFNMAGEVVGVTNMGYIFFGGLGFAIPIDYVKHFVENRDAFTYDKDNPNTGYRYIQPDQRMNKQAPECIKNEDKQD